MVRRQGLGFLCVKRDEVSKSFDLVGNFHRSAVLLGQTLSFLCVNYFVITFVSYVDKIPLLSRLLGPEPITYLYVIGIILYSLLVFFGYLLLLFIANLLGGLSRIVIKMPSSFLFAEKLTGLRIIPLHVRRTVIYSLLCYLRDFVMLVFQFCRCPIRSSAHFLGYILLTSATALYFFHIDWCRKENGKILGFISPKRRYVRDYLFNLSPL